jgi:hypothetical protein
MRVVIVVAWFVVACERSESSKPHEGSGSSELDVLVDDTVRYAEQMAPALLGFDGDCGKLAERMLTVEPLALSLRTRISALSADDRASFDARLKAMKSDVMTKFDKQLAAMGKTRDDVDRKEAEAVAACKDDPRVTAAMDRVGVFKRKRKQTP